MRNRIDLRQGQSTTFGSLHANVSPRSNCLVSYTYLLNRSKVCNILRVAVRKSTTFGADDFAQQAVRLNIADHAHAHPPFARRSEGWGTQFSGEHAESPIGGWSPVRY